VSRTDQRLPHSMSQIATFEMRELRRALKAIARRRGHAYISSHDPGTFQALATRPLVIVDEKSPYMGSFYPRCFSFRRRNEHRGGFDAAPEANLKCSALNPEFHCDHGPVLSAALSVHDRDHARQITAHPVTGPDLRAVHDNGQAGRTGPVQEMT
jgi:hypothetical protein